MKYYFLQQLWLLVWQKKAGHHISSSKICWLSKKCSLPDASKATLVNAKADYQAASLHYHQLKPLAAKLCSDFLHCCILDPQSSEAHTKAIANILCNKCHCESYQAVHHLKGVSQMTSVSQVETPSPTGPLLHTSQAKIEHQLGTAFSHCFQGANTPFLSDPLLYCVGMDGSSSATHAILDGTFVCPPGR